VARKYTIKGRIEAEDRATPTVKKVQKSVGGLSRFLTTGFVAGAAAAALSVRALVGAFKSAIGAANAQELAVKKLDTALAPLGTTAASVSADLQAFAASLQKVTTAGDETIIEGQALLASFTKNTDEIKAATQAALDLSAATGQSLQSAFLLMGRAASGETSTLTRYGITLDEGIPKSEKFAAALAKINEQFGGQAQAAADTFGGRLKQLGNAFGDVTEGLGFFISGSKETTSVLRSLTDALSSLANALPQVTKATDDHGKAVDRVFTAEENLSRAEAVLARARKNSETALNSLIDTVVKSTGGLTTVEVLEQRVAKASEFLTKALEEETAAWARSNLEKSEAAKIDDTLIDAARELGIVLREDVNTALDDQRKALESLRENKEKLGLTDADLAAAEEKLRAEQERLTQAFEDSGGSLETYQTILAQTASELGSYTETTTSAADGQRELAQEVERVSGSLRRQRAEIAFTTAAFDELRRSAGNAAAVQAALAAGGQLVLGGTRVNLAGGGSRLVGDRGIGSGNSFPVFGEP